MANATEQLNSKSFYGKSTKYLMHCNQYTRKQPYIPPLQRKEIREKQELANAQRKVLDDCQNTAVNSTAEVKNVAHNAKPKINYGSSGSYAFTKTHLKKTDCKNVMAKARSMSLSSPTINWAPSSLKKPRFHQSGISWKQLKLPFVSSSSKDNSLLPTNNEQSDYKICNPKFGIIPASNNGVSDCLDTHFESNWMVNSNCVTQNVECKESNDSNLENSLLQDSGSNKTLNKSNDTPCVKQLKFDLQRNNNSAEGQNKKKESEKLFAIFNSNSPKQSSPLLRSSVLKLHSTPDANNVALSPETCKVTLPGTPKTRQCSLLSKNSQTQQMIIDAGQKQFGAIQCITCRMVYTVSDMQDHQQHALYHKRFLSCLKFTGWKRERLVTSYFDGRILKVLSTDPRYSIKKSEEICSLIDTDLGFNNTKTVNKLNKVVYLFVSDNNQIVGGLIAEPIAQAYRLLPSYDNCAIMTSLVSEKVTCGVSRIWTYFPYRRRQVATRLMDALRSSFVLGSRLDINEIAFSDPTPDGRIFAAHYCKTKEFLTYNFCQ